MSRSFSSIELLYGTLLLHETLQTLQTLERVGRERRKAGGLALEGVAGESTFLDNVSDLRVRYLIIICIYVMIVDSCSFI